MCGIAGIIDWQKQPDDTLVKKMIHLMQNRGPDDAGLISLPYVVLGHRRLSILDLSPRGKQPMQSSDKRFWITFNGEIYNHVELRRQLQELGHLFYSRTDTECLLNGYKQWGEDLPRHCRGMWAFAIWDSQEESLFLSRDRAGEKPLFYYLEGSRLVFGSTLSAMQPAIHDCRISADAVASFLAYGYIPHTECIYEGIKKLEPAHSLVFNRDGIRIIPYWQLDYRNKLDVSPQEAERMVEETLDQVIQEQLEADVPVGVFLSGGLDSGCVAALASRHKPGIISVTMTVPEQAQYNEAALARLIAEKHGTTHVEVPLDQGCIRELPALLSASEPLGDSSLIPSAAVAKEAVKYVKVVLTGDGGDESFDGYGKMRLARDAYKARARISGRLLKLLSPVFVYLSQRLITPGLRTLGGYTRGRVLMTSAGLEAFVAARDYSPRDVRKLLYGPQLTPLLGRSYGCFLVEKLKQSHYNEWWEGWMSVGMKTYLPDDLLFKADTATMHHSLESRAPFLDQRVIELAASLPYECLLPGQYTKGLIRRIAARHNPLEAVYAPKKGFSIPVCHYFKAGWGEILLDLTRDGIAAQLGLLQPDGVRKYLDLHRSGKAMLEIPLYSLLVLELWLRVFYSKSIPADELGERLYQATQS